MTQERLRLSHIPDCYAAQPPGRQGAVTPKIVHLGIGAFHRAHQAVYTDEFNKQFAESDPWYSVGVSLRSASVAEQLNPQDGLYSVIKSSSQGSNLQLISSVSGVIVAPEDPAAVVDLLTKESTAIISLTITEKGYCHDPATGDLNQQHPDIQHDLENISAPKTAIGFIVSALSQRRHQGLQPPTILCCDNLPENGSTLKKIVTQFAQLVDETLAKWIETNVCFPNTMVDRIVPATTKIDLEDIESNHHFQDLGMVKTEEFSQWVIEDKFSSSRPAWEKVGAIIADDVVPYENAKLRLLNGAHSAIAYLGYLLDYEYVHEAMQDSIFVSYLKRMMHCQIMPTITPPKGLALERYINELLARFSNSSLNHRTYQIAMDGSQKMPQRLLHTIESRLESGEPIDYLCFAVAGWLRYSMGFNQKGDEIIVQDPMADELLAIRKEHFDNIDVLLENYLALSQVFSAKLRESDLFKDRLRFWLSAILANGVYTAMKVLLLYKPSATDT